jgi:hypothetical protein
MNEYLNLLLDFQTLTREAKAKTFMEISGQAHYENVASNILAFYFDPQEEHGLKNLLITAFLEMAGHQGIDLTEVDSIQREYPAETGKRIDLVIVGSDFVIGIENKIYHWEANDFENYGRVIDALSTHKSVTVKAVLGLHADARRPALPGDFKRFSYEQFWNYVRKNLGLYLPNANPKWVTYLIDFMETTSRLAGESQPNKEFVDFFLKHHSAIEQLVAERQSLINRLHSYNFAMEANLKSDLEKQECVLKVWVSQRSVFVVDFRIHGNHVAIDLAHTLIDWQLTIFGRDQKSAEFVRFLVTTESLRRCSLQIQPKSSRYLLDTWSIHVTPIELQDKLMQWVNAILAVANEFSDSSL